MAESLTVTITARDLVRQLALTGLRFDPPRYSFSVEGGPKQLTCRVYGDELALRTLFGGLRGQVEVWDGAAERAWWGCLWSVTIHTGALVYGRTLDEMANSVNISYLKQTTNQAYSGSGEQADTGFSTDAASIAEFGTIEKTLRGGNGSAAAATARQAMELANRKLPQQIFGTSTASDQGYADIVARGWIDTLDWRYYLNTTGSQAAIESNEVLTNEAMQFLGRAHPTSYYVRFGTGGVLTLLQNTAGQLAISELSPYNDIYITGATAAGNNIRHTVTLTLSPGSDYTVTPNVIQGLGGVAVVVHDVGTEIYQTFTMATDHAFDAAAIDLRLMLIGEPTDNVTIELYTDSAGTPNTLLATATITASEIQTSLAWVTGVFATPYALAYGTTYGILITRSGTENLACFAVGVDEALSYTGGALYLQSVGGAWVSRLVNADLIFKLSGIRETTTQISDIITAEGEFVTSVQIDNSAGIKVIPYQDGTLTALQIIRDLAAFGTSNNRRLLYKVTPERKLVIYEEPVYNTVADILVEENGVAHDRKQQPIPAHKCPYGQWVEFAPLVYYPNDEKYFFVDEAEYDGGRGTWRIVRLRNRASDMDLSRITQ